MNYLSLIIDIALIALFLIFIFDGRKKGFVKMALSIVATVLSIFVAKELCEPVALWIEENMIRQAATNSIANVLSFNIGNNIQKAIDALPAYIVNAAEYAGFSIDSAVSGEITLEAMETAVPQIYSAIKDFAIIPATKIVAFSVIYLVCNLILSIVVSFISKIFKLPVLKSFNKLFGGVLGGIKGLFAVIVVSLALGFATMIVVSSDFINAVENTYIQQTVWQCIVEFIK